MLSADVCKLPATGGSTFVLVAGLFLLIAGVLVTRWVRASAGRMSVVVAPLVLLGGLAFAPSVTNSCSQPLPTTAAPVTAPLVLEIDTTVDEQIEAFELGLFGDVNVNIYWGDGTSDDVKVAGPFPHTYATSGKYTITVTGTLTGFGQDSSTFVGGYQNIMSGAPYLTAVSSFGDLGITSLSYAFDSAINLVSVPATLPSTVTNLFGLFVADRFFNGDVSGWDTSNVTNMSSMFSQAELFNGDVKNWNTSNVTDMSSMFDGAELFNGDVSGWDTSKVTNLSSMFSQAKLFAGDVKNWNTSNVTDMSSMFSQAELFNGDVSGWDTSKVTNMKNMFGDANLFSGDVKNWNTSKVTNMASMFRGAGLFNGDVSGWDTSNVTDMNYMFDTAGSFNGDVTKWNTSKVTNMSAMFYRASAFNQSLGMWDISKVVDMTLMLESSGLTRNNYDATLNGWAALPIKQPNVKLGALGLNFSASGQNGRNTLTGSPNNWVITDSGR